MFRAGSSRRWIQRQTVRCFTSSTRATNDGTANLYVVADEYLQAQAILNDLELDDQTVADTLEGLKFPLEQKAEAVGMMVKNLDAFADKIDEAMKAMASRKAAIKNRADKIRDYLQAQMARTQITKIDAPHFALTIKKNPPGVDVFDAAAVPDEFKRIPPIPMPEPDKSKIKDALKAGTDVPGARLTQTTRLDIR